MATRKKSKPNLIDHQRRNRLLECLKRSLDTTRRRGMCYSHVPCSGTTKSWLTDSRRCRKQPQYILLVDITGSGLFDCSYCISQYWKPPPELMNMNVRNISRVASSRSYCIGYNCKVVITGVSNPAFAVCTSHNYWDRYSEDRENDKRRVITHKSTEIDPYDANNGVMKFSYVICSKDEKYYAVSLQGALVRMEQVDDQRIIITGICGTRAVPFSVSAKFFTEYLVESRGEIWLVFLIYKESVNKLADDIEVFRFDLDTLKLVRVDRLQGRALFLVDNECVCVDSKEVGCKGDNVYLKKEVDGNDEWRVFDMKSGVYSRP